MAGSDQKWVTLASKFPAGLDTETDEIDLTDGFTPDSYGVDIDTPGRLRTGSVPTGTGDIADTSSVGGNTYTWHYRRLWRINGVDLEYLAPRYRDIALVHQIPLSFEEDANALLTFFPFAGTSMFVAKSTGGYQIPGAASLAGNFQHDDIVESMQVSADGNAIAMDGIAYASNTHGLMAWGGGAVTELTALQRAKASDWADTAVTKDEQKRRIIGADKFVYDSRTKLFFDYSTSGFRFTSRTMTDNLSAPFTVVRVGFLLENSGKQDGMIKFQVKRDLEEWQPIEEVDVIWDDDTHGFVEAPLEDWVQAEKFTLRIESLSSWIYIRRIQVLVESNSDVSSYSQ